MKTIFKYQLASGKCTVPMPRGARILSAQMQGRMENIFSVWALVDADQPNEERRFVVYGTGWELPEDIDKQVHLATVQVDHGAYVWHVFEVKE